MIYFVTTSLHESVHAIGLGFTNLLHVYAEASTAAEAEETVTRHFEGQGVKVRRLTARPASQQDKNKYTFPERILQAPSTQATATR